MNKQIKGFLIAFAIYLAVSVLAMVFITEAGKGISGAENPLGQGIFVLQSLGGFILALIVAYFLIKEYAKSYEKDEPEISKGMRFGSKWIIITIVVFILLIWMVALG